MREDLGRELGQRSERQRRLLGGLQDDRVAGRQRRADLPDGHHQRVVPRARSGRPRRAARAGSSTCSRSRTRRRLLPSSSRAAPAKKRRLSTMNGISSRGRRIGLPTLSDSSSASSSACSSITSASASSASGALAGRGGRPVVEGGTRRVHGSIDIGRRRQRRLCDRLTRSRVQHRFGLPICRIDEHAVNEILKSRSRCRHDHTHPSLDKLIHPLYRVRPQAATDAGAHVDPPRVRG